MFREQDAKREVPGNVQRSILEASRLERFQVDLQSSVASRLLGASSPTTERVNVQAIVNSWTDSWAKISGHSATHPMPT
jgi:hypothetical protein